MGIIRRVSRRTARRTARRTTRRRTVGRSLLLGTGLAATAAVGYLLNRKYRKAPESDLPLQPPPETAGDGPDGFETVQGTA